MSEELHDLSRIQWLLHREGVDDPALYGVTKLTGTPRALCLVTESHVGAPGNVTSGIAKATRLPGPTRRVTEGSTGPLTTELFPGPQFEEMLEMSLAKVGTPELTGMSAIITISWDSGDNSINDSGSGFIAAGIQPYTWIDVRGASAFPGNLGRMKVISVTAGKLIIQGAALSIEAAGPSTTIVNRTFRNGVSLISAGFERQNSDGATEPYQLYEGCVSEGITVTISDATFLTVAMPMRGLGPLPRSALSVWDALTPIPVESIVDSLADANNNVTGFAEDGTANSNIREWSFNLNNNVSQVPVAQQLRPLAQSLGTAGLTGTLNGYQKDGSARLDIAQAHIPTSFSVEIVANDPAVPIYVFEIHRAKYDTQGDVGKSANDGKVPLDLAWTAEPSEIPELDGIWITISAFDPAP